MATYLEKEEQLVKAICDNANGPDKAFPSKDAGLSLVESRLKAFPQYVNAVVSMETSLPIIYARYEGQEVRDRVSDLDRRRKIVHDNAIASVNILNRVSEKLGLEPFADVDTNDRHAVADFCGRYVNETFNHGIGGGIDEAVKVKAKENKQYDEAETSRRIRDLDQKFGHITGKDGAESQMEP